MLSFQAAGGASSTVGEISVVAGNSPTNLAKLVYNSNAVTVNVTGSPLAAGSYQLMDCTGTITNNGLGTVQIAGTALSSGYTAAECITTNGPGHVDLIVNATPVFSGLTSPSITYGTTSVTLTGTVSSTSGPTTVYPASGDTVSATINGQTVNGTVTDSTGDFSIDYNDPSLATDGVGGSPYTITYSYAGNSSQFLNAAANDASTSLTITGAGAAPQGMTLAPVGGGLQLQFTGTPNYPYVLESATNLAPPVDWQPVWTNSADANSNWIYAVPNDPDVPARFYRAAGQ